MTNFLWIPLGLFLAVAQIPFFDAPREKLKRPESPVKGWWMVTYFNVPPTKYSKAGQDIIKAESRGSNSSLFKEVGEKESGFRILSWGWKVSNVVRSAIETRKDRYDTAARVIVVFGQERRYGLFKKGEPGGYTIEYIWASRMPKGQLFDRPGEKNTKVFVIESGDEKAGQWVYVSRNIRNDYKQAFGEDLPKILAIGIQTDTDQSNEMVTAFYSGLVLRK
jgi:hypothetical protein